MWNILRWVVDSGDLAAEGQGQAIDIALQPVVTKVCLNTSCFTRYGVAYLPNGDPIHKDPLLPFSLFRILGITDKISRLPVQQLADGFIYHVEGSYKQHHRPDREEKPQGHGTNKWYLHEDEDEMQEHVVQIRIRRIQFTERPRRRRSYGPDNEREKCSKGECSKDIIA